MKGRTRIFTGLLSVIAVIAVWDFVSRSGLVDTEIIPPATAILTRSWELLLDPAFWSRDIAASLRRLALATLITVPPAIFLGITAGISGRTRAAIEPLFNFTYPLPKVAVFPLILVLFGLGDSGKIALITLGMFYPLFLNVMNGVRRIDSSPLRDLIPVYGIRGRDLWLRFYFRGALPDLITGLKASLGYGFTLVVVSEITASNNGIGNFIWRSWDAFQLLDMNAGILILCLFGWVCQAALDRLLARTGFAV